MAKKSVGGRPSIYQPKTGKVQVRAITKEGEQLMDRVRRVVKGVSKWPGHVSDGDLVDYLLRCWRSGAESANDKIKPREQK